MHGWMDGNYVCVYVCMYVCMKLCMYVCIYACMHVGIYACMQVGRVCHAVLCQDMLCFMHVCTFVRVYEFCMCVRMHVSMPIFMCSCMHVCMCMYLCVYVRMYVCMYVCISCMDGQTDGWNVGVCVCVGCTLLAPTLLSEAFYLKFKKPGSIKQIVH